jgi:hypothetical protein
MINRLRCFESTQKEAKGYDGSLKKSAPALEKRTEPECSAYKTRKG